MIRLYALGCLLLLTVGCRRGTEQPHAAGNLILITLDTTRSDHLGCYGSRSAKTPSLDALAASGVRFTRATAQAPLTLPSHASIMTGEYPGRHGVRDMEGFSLDKAQPTLATLTAGNGFATAAFVGSRALAAHFGLANGFAAYDDNMVAERPAAVVTDRALTWLKENVGHKFFLWVHYYDPHEPYNPPGDYKRTYAADPYSGEIAYMDAQVGRLLEGVRQMGLSPRTMVAAIGDHGESLGEHGEATHGVFLYDSTLHVPFILAGPGVRAGKVINDQVRSVDLMPTLLAFLNLPSGNQVQGVSLWPLIEQGKRVPTNSSYSETLYPRTYMGWSELSAIRTDTWKFVAAPHPELYNLERDPLENQNVIADFPSEAARFQRQISGEQRSGRTSPAPVDGQTRRELESLGYLSGGISRSQQADAPDPKDRVEVLALLARAESALSSQDHRGVARVMERALKVDPTNPRCHLYLATAYEQTGQYPRAIEVLEHALHAKVETDRIYSRLGIDYVHVNRVGQAIEAMTRARQLNPNDLDNLLNLGMAHLQTGQLDEAEKAFRAITRQNDSFAPAHNGLGLLAVARRDVETARREFEKAVAVNPDEVKSLLDLGILYQQTGDREQSLRYLRLFMNKVPPGQFTDQLPAVRAAIRELSGGKEL